ncbi:hypothetical protein [Paraburkholderia caffeinilytica]|uniref:hypothetical protein n=1 Tax=Paraburkholderia caffeinilytica TaxID=1761016 RepID=UPI0038BB8B92
MNWKRNGATLCTCGLELGQAEALQASTDVAFVTKLMVGALLGTSEGDMLALSPFCPDLVNMSALEWLALFSYFATTSRTTRKFHPDGKDQLQVERDAVVIVARIFRQWPARIIEEISTCWRRIDLRASGSPIISLRELRSRDPVRHADRLRGPMDLPRFLRDAIDSYLSALTVHSQGNGLAVNPDWLAFGADGIPAIQVQESNTLSIASTGTTRKSKPRSLTRVVEELRQAKVVLHDLRFVEQLFRATSHQRLLLERCGFLRSTYAGKLIPSSEVDKLKYWFRCTGSLTKPSSTLVPLSAFSMKGGVTLQRVILAIQSRTMRLFRSSDDDIGLDTCFVAGDFLG